MFDFHVKSKSNVLMFRFPDLIERRCTIVLKGGTLFNFTLHKLIHVIKENMVLKICFGKT